MCRYLAHWPKEALRILRMLDLIAHGAPGHGLSICFLLLLLKLVVPGMVMNNVQGCSSSPQEVAGGPLQHFQSAVFEGWQLKTSAQLADRKGFRRTQFFSDIFNFVPLPT